MAWVSLNEHSLMAQGDLLLVDRPQRKALVEHHAESMDGAKE